MKIQVTQEDVKKSQEYQAENGIQDYVCNCPVANALERHTGKKWDVFMGYVLCFDGRRVATPQEVKGHIDHFDTYAEMPDFEFELPTI